MYTKGQLEVLVILPIVTGCISFIASATIMIMILRSNVKLSSIYRRLIFGLSAFDLVQSFDQATSTLFMPEGLIWGARGNFATCDLKGFLSIVGISGSVFYSLSLSVYFTTVIKFGVNEKRIKKHMEPFLHAIPIVLSFGFGFFLYATDNFGPTGLSCWIAPTPPNCHLNPTVECTSFGDVIVLRWIFGALPVFLSFGCNCILMAIIWHANHVKSKRNERYLASWMQGPLSPSSTRVSGSQLSRNSDSGLAGSSRNSQFTSSASIRRRKQIVFRALAFICSFLMTYTWTIIYRIFLTKTPYSIIVLSRGLIPLQGFFNVLVYASPHVVAYRRSHPSFTWLWAALHVIMSGGDKDFIGRGGGIQRRKSLRKEPAVMEIKDIKGCAELMKKIGEQNDNESSKISVSFMSDGSGIIAEEEYSSSDPEDLQVDVIVGDTVTSNSDASVPLEIPMG